MDNLIDDSVKFAWAYLLKHGNETDGKWDYYGGKYNEVGGTTWDWGKQQEKRQKLIDKVVSVGINWNLTEVPKVENESYFLDTFSPSGHKQATLGKLVLNNGKSFLIGSGDEDAAHLAETAKNLMQGKSDIMDLANKL